MRPDVPRERPPGAAGRAPEELSFGLSLAGRPAGTDRWTAGPEKGHWVIRRETVFAGPLAPGTRKLQVSRLDPVTGLPSSFAETTEGAARGHFEATFDRRSGLVSVRHGRDEASIAMTRDYHDPVSIIELLRGLPEDTITLRVPMVGGTVLVTRLPDATVDTPWGATLARVYYLRPGVGVVYVEAAEPHRPLRFTQKVADGILEAAIGRGGSRPATQAPQARPAARQPQRGPGGQPKGQGPQRRQGGGRPDAQRPPEKPPAPVQEAKPEGGGGRRRRRRRSGRGKAGGSTE